jgi:hypothetical protein
VAPKVFPDLLGERIFPTRQEVFYFGVPAGDERFGSRAMPVWVDFGRRSTHTGLRGARLQGRPDRH